MTCNRGRHLRRATDGPWNDSMLRWICPTAWRCGTAQGCFVCYGRTTDASRLAASSVAHGRTWHLRFDEAGQGGGDSLAFTSQNGDVKVGELKKSCHRVWLRPAPAVSYNTRECSLPRVIYARLPGAPEAATGVNRCVFLNRFPNSHRWHTGQSSRHVLYAAPRSPSQITRFRPAPLA
jgi:hypothetical protein